MDKVITSDDIIQKIALKFKLPEYEVREAVENNINFIKHLIDNEDTLSIRIPHLGNFYFHFRSFLRLKLSKLKDNKKIEKYEEEILNNLSKKEEKFKEYSNDVRYMGIDVKKFSRHYKKKLLRVKWYSSLLPITEIENKQNKYFNGELTDDE